MERLKSKRAIQVIQMNDITINYNCHVCGGLHCVEFIGADMLGSLCVNIWRCDKCDHIMLFTRKCD